MAFKLEGNNCSKDYSVIDFSRLKTYPVLSSRDTSFSELRASSGDLSKIGSANETLNSYFKQELESRFQSGVLRTNCIDCLDRTNVAQYAYGLAALGRQLEAMGLTDMPKVDADSSIATTLMDMYMAMGDALAQQYGGSAAHNTVMCWLIFLFPGPYFFCQIMLNDFIYQIFPERQGKSRASTNSSEFMKYIKRYYSNAYTDGDKQDAINLYVL